MRNKKVILSSILSLVLCLSLIAGGTFALFTSESKTNIAITSGNVEVVAWLDDIKTSTFGTVQAENTFELGGSATYDATTNKLTVDKIAPGDRVDLNVYIENKSNIAVSYRVKVAFVGELQDALVANITLPGDESATVLTSADVATGWNSFDETNKVVLPMSVELPYGVGNDYMNKSAEIIVTVEAVQANATELVMIENTRYNSFAEALNAANTGDTIVIGGVAEYDFGTVSNQNVDANGVTVVGIDGASLVFSGDGANNTFTNVKLENLTVVDTTTSYAESSWEFGYLELADITATDVVFANGIMLDGTNSFTACTFTGKTESGLTMYGAWVNGSTSNFTNCTFVGTRGLKAHEAYGSEVTAVTVEGCAFNGMTEKPGIALGTLNADTTVTLKNNTFTDTQPGDGAYSKNAGVPYQYETDTDVTTFTFVAENNSTIINVYTVDDIWAVTNVSNCIKEDGTVDRTNVPVYNMAEVTVNIMADLDMGETWWRPICQYPSSESVGGFAGTINGNGHTIYNFKSSGNRTIDSSTMLDLGWGHCQGFIGIAGGCTVKDLTFVDAQVYSQNSSVGTIIGNSNGNNTIDNCHIIGMTAESNYYIAGIIGQAANGDAITNCSVKDVTITSWYTTTPENYSGALYGSIKTYDHDGDSTTDKIKGTVDTTGSTWENVVIKYTVDGETLTVDATH